MPQAPTPPNPAPDPAPQATPPQAPEPSHAEKLHRALSVEVEQLRQQVAAVPDAEALAELRQKAEKFDQIAQQLPQWQQQLSALHQQELTTLQQQHQTAQVELQQARFTLAAAAEFARGGGLSEHFDAFRGMVGPRLTAGPDGAPLLDGEPLGKRFAELVEGDRHSLLAAMARPKLGSGSGARGSRDGRAAPGSNLSLKTTSKRDLFAAGFGGGTD